MLNYVLHNVCRCVDFVFYYPNQNIPNAGSCGLGSCGGSILGESKLDDDSDFNRTFGIVDTCTGALEEVCCSLLPVPVHEHNLVQLYFVYDSSCEPESLSIDT